MLKQAQQMGSKLQGITEQLKAQRATGAAGGGMVTVEVNGVGEVLKCRIDPSLSTGSDRELIEDLLPAAINQALAKAKELHAEAVRSLTTGMDMPGLDEMMSQITGNENRPAT
jgi:DNA-binding YbaB/EbfC family protein